MYMLDQRIPTRQSILSARTAGELMTPNPVSIRQSSTVAEAAAFLSGRGISAAPVIDDAGRPVGVVSRTDILARYQAVRTDATPVHTVMTPAIFSVRPDTPAMEVIETMVDLGVRRLFVVDESGVLVGVISALDVLGQLRRQF
jgi:CBS domain-containing protein